MELRADSCGRPTEGHDVKQPSTVFIDETAGLF